MKWTSIVPVSVEETFLKGRVSVGSVKLTFDPELPDTLLFAGTSVDVDDDGNEVDSSSWNLSDLEVLGGLAGCLAASGLSLVAHVPT